MIVAIVNPREFERDAFRHVVFLRLHDPTRAAFLRQVRRRKSFGLIESKQRN